jgi:hypothetical protein
MFYFVQFQLSDNRRSEWLAQVTEEEAARPLREIYVAKTGTFINGVRITSEKLSRVSVVRSPKKWAEWKEEVDGINANLVFYSHTSVEEHILANAERITNAFFRKHVVAAQAHQAPSAEVPLYVFISYSHDDDPSAKAIADALHEIGVSYFLDKKDIAWGDRIKDSVREALRKCTHQIIILSPATDDSKWVHYECGVADGGSKTLLPFRLHPRQKLPGYMTDILAKDTVLDVKTYFQSKKG